MVSTRRVRKLAAASPSHRPHPSTNIPEDHNARSDKAGEASALPNITGPPPAADEVSTPAVLFVSRTTLLADVSILEIELEEEEPTNPLLGHSAVNGTGKKMSAVKDLQV